MRRKLRRLSRLSRTRPNAHTEHQSNTARRRAISMHHRARPEDRVRGESGRRRLARVPVVMRGRRRRRSQPTSALVLVSGRNGTWRTRWFGRPGGLSGASYRTVSVCTSPVTSGSSPAGHPAIIGRDASAFEPAVSPLKNDPTPGVIGASHPSRRCGQWCVGSGRIAGPSVRAGPPMTACQARRGRAWRTADATIPH
jgi:hypothetical protein